MDILAAKDTDALAIAEIERECFSAPWSAQAIGQTIKTPSSVVLVAAEGERIIGYVSMNTVLDEGYINNVAVLKSCRQKGVATALILRLIDLAKERELSFITLEVRQSNAAAISLYKRLGFDKEGIRRGFYVNPTEDADIMTKRFEKEQQ